MEELDLNKANDAIGEYKASEYQDWLDLEPEPTRQMLEAPQAQPSELSEAPTNQPAERKSEL